MKIAIPSETEACLDSTRSGHFGHTPYFTIVTFEDGQVVSVEAVKNVDHDTVGCGGVIDYVLGLGVDGILTVGMGRPPFERFTRSGVAVYTEGESPLVGQVVERFSTGEVRKMELDDACNHH